IDHVFVMVFHGMCHERGKNDYIFFAPYYGDGSSNQRRGLCHVADCPLLDPLYYQDTNNWIRYEEHSGTFKQTWGEFNSKYIGGVAHELGHALSLPHNRESPEEKAKLGTALMGGGNHTFRNERRGGKGSFLSPASAARLAAHPLFTGSDRKRQERSVSTWQQLDFAREHETLVIRGQGQANPDAFAVIAYADPEGGGNYDARTNVSPVEDGGFEVKVAGWNPGQNKLRLTSSFLNGATHTVEFPLLATAEGLPDVAALIGMEQLHRIASAFMDGNPREGAEIARKALKDTRDLRVAAKLRHAMVLAEPPPSPVVLSTVTANEAYLSDLTWEVAEVGWGKPARNQYYHDARIRDALFLELDGEFFAKGLYAHAPSRYTFRLGGKWKNFQATIGLQEEAHPSGTGVFVVKGDGKELTRKAVFDGARTAKLAVDITGVDRLDLIVESGKQGNASCWTVWGAPRLSR
ncbi:MAG: NPCBM/NEW2 domain-containing protein, partial [Verrucomicrobiota bacterium]